MKNSWFVSPMKTSNNPIRDYQEALIGSYKLELGAPERERGAGAHPRAGPDDKAMVRGCQGQQKVAAVGCWGTLFSYSWCAGFWGFGLSALYFQEFRV